VIEGFYGPPWSPAERASLFADMAGWGMNTYLYAPKDDLKHRAIWRELYSAQEAGALRRLIEDARQRGIRFFYALAPGLDVRYSDSAEFDRLLARLEQMIGLGCRHFALLFDDIPDRMRPEDRARFPSFAEAQCDWANRAWAWTRARAPGGCWLFCPTAYCGRMADGGVGGAGYLDRVGQALAGEIELLWTGPEIISREISAGHLREVAARLRRKPLLWDNLHANDYDGRRFFCGPYAGRAPEIRGAVSGILTNPNTELALNYVPLRTCAEFAWGGGEWDARDAYLRAMRGWLSRFATVSQPIAFEDLVLLGDAYYLPHEDGPEAQALFESAQALLGADPRSWEQGAIEAFQERAARLRDVCARLAGLEDRSLFWALSRRVWELREELDLLLGYIRLQSDRGAAGAPARSDFHLPGTYRGGFVARLQRLLEQHPDGTFTARETHASAAAESPHGI